MPKLDDLQGVMERLGPVDADVVTILQADDTLWIVRYEDVDVEIEFDRATESLSLQADVGFVRPEDHGAVYATMMQYNLLKRDTGGFVLASKADHTAVLMLDQTGEMPDEGTLEAILSNFVAKARVWRSLVASGDAAPTETAADESFFMVRV